jgi:hypothetical protein
MKASKTPQWMIRNFRWDEWFEPNPMVGQIHSQYWSFNLTNTANNYTVPCTVGGRSFTGPMLASAICENNFRDFGDGMNPIYWIETDVSWDWSSNTLAIDQTWHCDDESPLTPYAHLIFFLHV